MSYRLTYYDPDGTGYLLNDDAHTFLIENGLRGFGAVRATAASSRIPYRDGETLLGGLYTPARQMEVALEILHLSLPDWTALVRALARGVSAYKDKETLGRLQVVTPDGLTREIPCWMVEWPDPEMLGPTDGKVIPVFWAPSPWFRDPAQVRESLSLPPGDGFSIPLSVPISLAATDIDGYLYLDNQGDVEAWPTIRIAGPCDNPAIANETTGKVLALTQAQDTGDYIEIDMEAATIVFCDQSAGTTTNIIQAMSDASEFWPLARGNNTLHLTAAGATGGSIMVSYHTLYQQV